MSFKYYYLNRHSGDLNKLALFDYFCFKSLDSSNYFLPIYLREGYNHFTDLGDEIKEFKNTPFKLDLGKRVFFIKGLTDFFFNLDRK